MSILKDQKVNWIPSKDEIKKVEDAAAEIDENKDARAGNKPSKKVSFKQDAKGEKVIKGRFNRAIAAEKEARKQEVIEKNKPKLLGKRERTDVSKETAPAKRPKKF
jgi:hypothetical protein